MDSDASFLSDASAMTHRQDTWTIDTYLRVKPSFSAGPFIDYNTRDVIISDRETRSLFELEIPLDSDPGILHNNSSAGNLRFEFNKVLDETASQEAVFDTVARSRIDGVLEGINSTIFAYGQTGSGKTYSIFGGEAYRDRGIIPRSLAYLFDKINRRKEHDATFDFRCKISFTQVYQENIYDLLNRDFSAAHDVAQLPAVQLLESEDGIVLRGLNVFEVDNQDSALKLFFFGNANRLTASTSMNLASSRSHAVFTVLIETEGLVDEKTVYTSGKLNFVDLAGSERMYKMQNSKEQLKEAKAINLSLHFLEQVIVSLRDNMSTKSHRASRAVEAKSSSSSTQAQSQAQAQAQAQEQSSRSRRERDREREVLAQERERERDKTKELFVPYRNSVLTSMLRDSLGGNCRSSFLLTIAQERLHFEETVATCRFGQRCGAVKVRITANTEIGLTDQLRDLQQRVKTLEKKLSISEETRMQLEQQLLIETQLRHMQTELRTLSEAEKARCKVCVQNLLTAAKESLSLSLDAEQLIEHSQDVLYNEVEEMDKAVLVELSTALGGLVQSLYIEREISKQEETLREARRTVQQAEEVQRSEKESETVRVFETGRVSETDSTLSPPAKVLSLLTRGRLFYKHNRFGSPKLRHYSLDEDLRTLHWHNVASGNAPQENESAPLNTWERVELIRGKTISLKFHPRSGEKDVVLDFLECPFSEFSFESECNIWLETINLLIRKGGR